MRVTRACDACVCVCVCVCIVHWPSTYGELGTGLLLATAVANVVCVRAPARVVALGAQLLSETFTGQVDVGDELVIAQGNIGDSVAATLKLSVMRRPRRQQSISSLLRLCLPECVLQVLWSSVIVNVDSLLIAWL